MLRIPWYQNWSNGGENFSSLCFTFACHIMEMASGTIGGWSRLTSFLSEHAGGPVADVMEQQAGKAIGEARTGDLDAGAG